MSRVLFTYWIVVLAVLAQACDIFQTRDPASPTTGTSSTTQAVQPQIVLDNLQSAIAQANADNYVRSFADTSDGLPPFRFIPTAEVTANYANTFRDWSVSDERNYFLKLGKPVNGTPLLSFTNVSFSSVSSDSALYSMNYSLYYPHNQQGIPEVVDGKMQLDLKPDSHGVWYIVVWQDYKTDSDSTWSYLKARIVAN